MPYARIGSFLELLLNTANIRKLTCTPTKSNKKLANSSSKEGFRDESQSDSSLSEKRFSEMPGISVNSEEAVMMDVFAPKCLCLVSRASYFDILKVCLLL